MGSKHIRGFIWSNHWVIQQQKQIFSENAAWGTYLGKQQLPDGNSIWHQKFFHRRPVYIVSQLSFSKDLSFCWLCRCWAEITACCVKTCSFSSYLPPVLTSHFFIFVLMSHRKQPAEPFWEGTGILPPAASAGNSRSLLSCVYSIIK